MIKSSNLLTNVKYEIRGPLAKRAHELEIKGYEVISLNIGNPGLYGFRTPENMRLAMIENLESSEAYCDQKGVFPAREAIVMQQQERGLDSINADRVFIGNGVSELIDLTLRALLNPGDEVLVPSPDYPLWSAATFLNGGVPVYYPCPKSLNYSPDVDTMSSLVGKKTRAIVLINPNNPTGAVYDKDTLLAISNIARKNGLIILSDEIYDQMTYPGESFVPIAPFCPDIPCATFSGLSKVYRACGYRVGWASFSGSDDSLTDLLASMDLLAALRLCSNVPGQWAVQTALGGTQSIKEICAPGGRLYKTRNIVTDLVTKSPYLDYIEPAGAMYAYISVDKSIFPNFDDQEFALKLLEEEHILIAPGSSFNVPYSDHFRITLLPEEAVIKKVFKRINRLLEKMLKSQ